MTPFKDQFVSRAERFSQHLKHLRSAQRAFFDMRRYILQRAQRSSCTHMDLLESALVTPHLSPSLSSLTLPCVTQVPQITSKVQRTCAQLPGLPCACLRAPPLVPQIQQHAKSCKERCPAATSQLFNCLQIAMLFASTTSRFFSDQLSEMQQQSFQCGTPIWEHKRCRLMCFNPIPVVCKCILTAARTVSKS